MTSVLVGESRNSATEVSKVTRYATSTPPRGRYVAVLQLHHGKRANLGEGTKDGDISRAVLNEPVIEGTAGRQSNPVSLWHKKKHEKYEIETRKCSKSQQRVEKKAAVSGGKGVGGTIHFCCSL